MLEDRPTNLPDARPDGSPLKPVTELLLERRATNSFTDEEVPDEYLEAILRLAAQAPSGYNFQPWRFVVVRDAESRRRLQSVAFGQAKVAEASVVVIAVGMKQEWKETADEVLREGARRMGADPDGVERYKQQGVDFVSSMDPATWVNRHVMIAVTTMMIAAEAYGFDTAPMEGFDAEGVKREFGIPDEGEVVSLLAIGRAKQPDKAYTGRFPLGRIVFGERFGEAWGAGGGGR